MQQLQKEFSDAIERQFDPERQPASAPASWISPPADDDHDDGPQLSEAEVKEALEQLKKLGESP